MADLWGGVYFAIINTKKETDAVYITHDYGTAFGLALLGKKYVYVSHLQGPKVEEKINYNEHITRIDKLLIRFCERYVFKKSLYVCFPSKGAEEYYFNSKYRGIDRAHANVGPTLYNTLYANPELKPVNDLLKKSDTVTFLSVGALTSAKGIDLIPPVFEEYLKKCTKKIRWIIVGQGPLLNDVKQKVDKINNENFETIFIESCSYPEIRYLLSISDVYIMFHRISVFDLATLEAMNDSKCIILSDVGGNKKFNLNDNIVFYKGSVSKTADFFIESNLEELKLANTLVYHQHFSNENFIKSYRKVIDDLISI